MKLDLIDFPKDGSSLLITVTPDGWIIKRQPADPVSKETDKSFDIFEAQKKAAFHNPYHYYGQGCWRVCVPVKYDREYMETILREMRTSKGFLCDSYLYFFGRPPQESNTTFVGLQKVTVDQFKAARMLASMWPTGTGQPRTIFIG